MATERTSAEKDLLRIIENPAAAEAAKKGPSGPVIVAADSPKKGFFSFLKPNEGAGSGPKTFSLSAIFSDKKKMISLLAIVTIGVFILFVLTFIREYMKLQSLKNLAKIAQPVPENEKPADAVTEPAKAETEEASTFSEVVRNIFKPAAQQKKVEEEKKDDLTLMMQDYRLVGLSIASSPEESYGMVENAKTKTTSFLKRGETLNGAELADINEEKLVFKANGRKVELR